MKSGVFFLLMATVAVGQDIPVPFDEGGRLLIRDSHFIRIDQFNIHRPELTFTLVDESSAPWNTLTLRFAMGGFCEDGVRIWYELVPVSQGEKHYEHTVQDLVAGYPLQGCTTEMIEAGLSHPSGVGLILTANEVLDHKAARVKAKFDAQAEIDAEKDAADAAETAREKRIADAERKRRTEEEARAHAICVALYRATADKKVGDLTVKESQQIKACQALGLYWAQ